MSCCKRYLGSYAVYAPPSLVTHPPALPSEGRDPRGGWAATVMCPLRWIDSDVSECCVEKGSGHPFRCQEGRGSWGARGASLST